jgi:hypothetical protein
MALVQRQTRGNWMGSLSSHSMLPTSTYGAHSPERPAAARSRPTPSVKSRKKALKGSRDHRRRGAVKSVGWTKGAAAFAASSRLSGDAVGSRMT